MDNAHDAVTVGHCADQHPECQQVVDIVKVTPPLHFLVNAVYMLGSTGQFGFQTGFAQFLFQYVDYLSNEVFPLRATFCQQGNDTVERFRLQILESQVFQLPLQFPYAESVGELGIDFQCLL